MKRPPKGVLVVHIPLYGGYVWVARSQAQYNATLEYLDIETDDALPCAGCAQRIVNKRTGGRIYLLGLFEAEPGTLAHEVAHIAFYVFEDVGAAALDGKCNEAYCYLLGWLVWKIKEGLQLWQ